MWNNVEIFRKIIDDHSLLPARADSQRRAGDEADCPQIRLSRRHCRGGGRQREENSWVSDTEKGEVRNIGKS